MPIILKEVAAWMTHSPGSRWSLPFSMIDELFNEFGPDLQKKIFGKK